MSNLDVTCEPRASGFWLQHRYTLVLASFSILLISSSVLPNSFLGCLLFCSLMTLTLTFTTVADCCESKFNRITLFLGISAISLSWINLFVPTKVVSIVHNVMFVMFFLRCALNILNALFGSKNVNADSIRGAITVYLLIGVSFVYLYGTLMLLDSRSIVFQETSSNVQFGLGTASFPDLVYFSFVTMSTLGYGDVTPVSSFAKTLAVFQAVVGQFYLAVLVAKLVVLSEFHSRESNSSELSG